MQSHIQLFASKLRVLTIMLCNHCSSVYYEPGRSSTESTDGTSVVVATGRAFLCTVHAAGLSNSLACCAATIPHCVSVLKELFSIKEQVDGEHLFKDTSLSVYFWVWSVPVLI